MVKQTATIDQMRLRSERKDWDSEANAGRRERREIWER
jgi:hypothetical protein